jgi:hypothetical protein
MGTDFIANPNGPKGDTSPPNTAGEVSKSKPQDLLNMAPPKKPEEADPDKQSVPKGGRSVFPDKPMFQNGQAGAGKGIDGDGKPFKNLKG